MKFIIITIIAVVIFNVVYEIIELGEIKNTISFVIGYLGGALFGVTLVILGLKS